MLSVLPDRAATYDQVGRSAKAEKILEVQVMSWIPYLIIVLGITVLIMIPFLVHIIRTNPVAVLRPKWQNILSPRVAEIVGILVILIAALGGLWAIWTGFKLISMLT